MCVVYCSTLKLEFRTEFSTFSLLRVLNFPDHTLNCFEINTNTHTHTVHRSCNSVVFSRSQFKLFCCLSASRITFTLRKVFFFPLKMSNNYLTKINNNHPFPLPNVQVPRIIVFVNMCVLVPLFVYHTCLNRIRATTTDCHIILFIKIFHRDNGNCR